MVKIIDAIAADVIDFTSLSWDDLLVLSHEVARCCEFGLDVMNDLEGMNVGAVKQKLAMCAGETDEAITVDLPEVRDMG